MLHNFILGEKDVQFSELSYLQIFRVSDGLIKKNLNISLKVSLCKVLVLIQICVNSSEISIASEDAK